MKKNYNYNGVLNVYKEKGYTSQDVVSVVRGIYGKVKAGHTGTLDPDACGVLPVCLGRATKIASYFSDSGKEYRAVVKLGETTDTEDASGTVLETKPVDYNEERILETINSFQGEYLQTPPMYSSVKINGERLYSIARKGETIERTPRLVYIYSVKASPFEHDLKQKNMFEITVHCSKGTYIRTLCADIGKKLGCGAHMFSLLRTKVGKLSLESAQTLDMLKKSTSLEDSVIPMDYCINNILDIKKINVQPWADKYLYNGNKIKTAAVVGEIPQEGELVSVYDSKQQLIGIYESGTELLVPKTILYSPVSGN